MKSIESRLSRLEEVAPFPNYQFLAVADTPDEANRIRQDLDARGVEVGLFIHTYLKPGARHES